MSSESSSNNRRLLGGQLVNLLDEDITKWENTNSDSPHGGHKRHVGDWTPELHKDLVEKTRQGLSLEEAMGCNGLTRDTAQRWLRRGRKEIARLKEIRQREMADDGLEYDQTYNIKRAHPVEVVFVRLLLDMVVARSEFKASLKKTAVNLLTKPSKTRTTSYSYVKEEITEGPNKGKSTYKLRPISKTVTEKPPDVGKILSVLNAISVGSRNEHGQNSPSAFKHYDEVLDDVSEGGSDKTVDLTGLLPRLSNGLKARLFDELEKIKEEDSKAIEISHRRQQVEHQSSQDVVYIDADGNSLDSDDDVDTSSDDDVDSNVDSNVDSDSKDGR